MMSSQWSKKSPLVVISMAVIASVFITVKILDIGGEHKQDDSRAKLLDQEDILVQEKINQKAIEYVANANVPKSEKGNPDGDPEPYDFDKVIGLYMAKRKEGMSQEDIAEKVFKVGKRSLEGLIL